MANILLLCQRIPYPPNKGEKIRAFHILQHLSQTHRVYLGCFVDDKQDWQGVGALRALCAEAHFEPLNPLGATLRSVRSFLTGAPLSASYYANRGMARWVRGVLRNEAPQAALIYSSVMGQYLKGTATDPMRVVTDFVDVDSDKWRQYAASKSWPMNWVYAREANTLLHYDRALALRSAASVVVSEAEAALFRALAPESAGKIYAINNGVDSKYFNPDAVTSRESAGVGPHFVFTGTMDYWPNVDAVVWFARAVLPLLQRHHPAVRFTIVGVKPAPAVMELADQSGVTVTGRVEDVRPYLAGADAIVAPMRLARGIQNKVLEGMSMAKPVVTTPQGLEGIHASAGSHVLVAENAEDFTAACLQALSINEAQTLGAAARTLILERYQWRAKLSEFEALLGLES